TSQNHGFCVELNDNHKKEVEISHVSLFGSSIEGISHTKRPIFSVQYHPESSPGPHDSKYLFTQFVRLMNESKNNQFS
ncbi:MAG: carbamoyl-phosphate synthase small subunit, partial [Burkholderiales bacterium]|nr:carbamoyl-phosphate synthase small subunit [Burkholderiales bacterium]